MKSKRIAAFLLAALMAFALCACSGGENLSAEEVLTKMEENSQNMQSASFEGDFTMKMSISGQTMDMGMKINGAVIVTPEAKAKMTMEVNYLGQSESMETYLMQQDGKYLMYMKSGDEWVGSEVASEEEFKAIQEAASNTAMLDTLSEGSNLTKLDDEELDGTKCYVLSMNITADALSKAMSSSLGDEADSLTGMFAGMGDIPVKLWVNKSDCTPVKIEIQMKDVLQSAITSQLSSLGEDTSSLDMSVDECAMTMTYTGFNNVEDFQLPEEAASAEIVANEKGPVAGVAQAAMPSVVAITSVSMQEIRSFFGYGMEYPSTGSGSGIIVGENDDELLIATNNHVVEGATTLSVCFIGSDVVSAEQETENYINGNGDLNIDGAVSAKIKGTDEDTDLAVIAVEKSDIPEETMSQIKIAQLGNSDDLAVGEQVVAIGNALGYGQTVTSGWISALDRTVQSDSNTYEELIQTDAAINPGNSGGALLNMQGELIGINCAKIASSSIEGTGYAIPISKAQPILEELMNRKTRDKVSDESQIGYLGVKFADLSREAIQMYNMPSGAFVMDVYPGEAADNAGIQKSDIIIKLDGQKVSSKADINDKLQYYSAGEEIEIEVARLNNGEYEESTVTVTLSARPDGNQ